MIKPYENGVRAERENSLCLERRNRHPHSALVRSPVCHNNICEHEGSFRAVGLDRATCDELRICLFQL